MRDIESEHEVIWLGSRKGYQLQHCCNNLKMLQLLQQNFENFLSVAYPRRFWIVATKFVKIIVATTFRNECCNKRSKYLTQTKRRYYYLHLFKEI